MVTATHRATLIGVFDTPDSARRAVESLHRAGFANSQITMVTHHKEQESTEVTDLDAAKAAQVTGETKEGEGLAVGAVTGAIVGGAIAVAALAMPGVGPIFLAGSLITSTTLAGLATGVVGGAVGGGLVGALVGLDFPEEEARLYERELKAGRTLVGVKAGDRANEAWDIISGCGGYELAHEHPDIPAPEPEGL
jgi:hypothetical protein